MGEDLGIGISCLQLHDALHGELFVHVAGTVPEQHLAPCDGVDVVAQVPVGTEDDGRVLRKAFHNLTRVARGHDHVSECLDGSGRVDIGDDRVVRMFVYELGKAVGRTTVGERTACCQVGDKHFLVGTKDFGCLAHEVYAAHHEDVGIATGCPLCEGEAVAHEVGKVLDLAFLVVVCQDDGILLFT